MLQDIGENQRNRSINTQQLHKVLDEVIEHIQKTQNNQKEKDGQRLLEAKLKFLRSLQGRLNDIQIDVGETHSYGLLILRYSSEPREIFSLMMELAIMKYDLYREQLTTLLYYTMNPESQNFSTFNLQEIDFLKEVLDSKTLKQYHSLMLKFRTEILNWTQIKLDCLSYFKEHKIGRMTCQYEKQILGFVLLNGQLIISDIYSHWPRIETLVLIHLYFQLKFGSPGIIYQWSIRGVVEFESEMFPIKFNQYSLTQERVQLLENIQSWQLDRENQQSLRQQLNKSQPISQSDIVNQVNLISNHNWVLQSIIRSIQQILVDLTKMNCTDLILKYGPEQKQINIKKIMLSTDYTSLEYYNALRDFIIVSIYDQTKLQELKKYQTEINLRITEIFEFLISSTDYCKTSLLQQLLIWILQYDFNTKVEECGDICFDVISKKTYQVILPQDLLETLMKIVESPAVKEVVMRINSINGRISKDKDIRQEYEDLEHCFRQTPIIAFDIIELYGISSINGRIGVNSQKLFSDKIQDKAMVLITLVHEAYCHKKRRDYVCPDNVLQLTPQQMNDEEKKQEKNVSGESGYFFEDEIFGMVVNGVSFEQAVYILNPLNWLKPKVSFRVDFKALPKWDGQSDKRKKQWTVCIQRS